MLQMMHFTLAVSVILILGLAGNAPRRPRYPSATNLVGMEMEAPVCVVKGFPLGIFEIS